MAKDGWLAKVDETVLGTDDFQEIRREVQPIAGMWPAFAQGIGLMPSDVREIELAQRGDPSRCLDSAIEKWLNQGYNTERFGLPSWKGIAMGIKQCGNPALAKRIAESHPKSSTCSIQ
ncbi:hypothetical protein EMCRGX_G005767 [Ephydatia muelleri]